MKAFINTNSKNNIVNSPNSNPINNLNPDKNITTRINLEKLKLLDDDIKTTNLKFKDKIYSIYITEFEEKISDILILKESDFMCQYIQRMKLVIEDLYSEDAYENSLFVHTVREVEKKIYEEIYKKSFTLLNKELEEYFRGEAKISSKGSTEKNNTPNRYSITPNTNTNVIYLKNFRKHCRSTDHAYHKCGGKFISVFDDKKMLSHVICSKCHSAYFSHSILMFCTTCNEEYYSCHILNNDKNYQPATWEKYHCGALVNDQMRCIKCREPFYFRMNDGKLICLNKNCRLETDPMKIFWVCILCRKEFKTNAKIYNPMEFKFVKLAIQNALLNKVMTRPINNTCCEQNISKSEFFHKIECRGVLYNGMIEDKKIVVCSKCKIYTNYDKFIWTCPVCLKRFKQKDKNCIVNKNNYNIIINENESVLLKTDENWNSNTGLELTPEKERKRDISSSSNNIINRIKNVSLSINRYDCNKEEKETLSVVESSNGKKSTGLIIDSSSNNNNNLLPITEKKQKSFNIVNPVRRSEINLAQSMNNLPPRSNSKFIIRTPFKNSLLYLKDKLLDDDEESDETKEIANGKEVASGFNNNFTKSSNDFNKNKQTDSNNDTENVKNNNDLKIERKFAKNSLPNNISSSNTPITNIRTSNFNFNQKFNRTNDLAHRNTSSNITTNEREVASRINLNLIKTPRNSDSKFLLEEIKGKQGLIFSRGNEERSPVKFNLMSISIGNNEISLQSNSNNKSEKGIDEAISNKNKNNIYSKKQIEIKQKEDRENKENKEDKENNPKTSDSKNSKDLKDSPIKILAQGSNLNLLNNSNITPLYDNNSYSKLNLFKVEEYNLITQIGEGSFGKIYLVEDKFKNIFSMKKIIANDDLDLESFQQEYELVNKVRHDHIIKILGVCKRKLDATTHVLYILMEVGMNDWEKEIKSRQNLKQPYTEKDLIEIMKHLISALAFLQKNSISHRDIKPQNVLLFKNDIFKVADFGEAKQIMKLETNKQLSTLRGTELYMSPILFNALRMNQNDIKHNSYKSDVFSLGFCILYAATLNINVLYECRNLYDNKIVNQFLNKTLKNKFSTGFINVIGKMLEISEEKRYDFLELESVFLELEA